MGKHLAFASAALAAAVLGCSSLSIPDDGVTSGSPAIATSADVCTKLAAKSGSCGWSQSATVGCDAALRDAAGELTTSLGSCLAIESCTASRKCLDDALNGATTVAPDDGGADADVSVMEIPDAATDAATDTGTVPAEAGTTTCTHSVPFTSTTCKACMDTSCCGESAICGKSPACLDLLSCVSSCAVGDAACENTCKSVRASSTISAFDDLRTCRNASCAAMCPAF